MTHLELTQPHARASHPQTSHDAAASVTGLRDKQRLVLALFRTYGPLTLEEVVMKYPAATGYSALSKQSDSGLRTRVSELVKLGLVEPTEETRIMSTGRKAVVWRAV